MTKIKAKLAVSIIWIFVSLTILLYSFCVACGVYYFTSYEYTAFQEYTFGAPIMVSIIIVSFGMLATALGLTIMYGTELQNAKRKDIEGLQQAQLIQLLKTKDVSNLRLEEVSLYKGGQPYGDTADHDSPHFTCPECGTALNMVDEETFVCNKCGKKYKLRTKNPYVTK